MNLKNLGLHINKNKFYSALPLYLLASIMISARPGNNDFKEIILNEKPYQAQEIINEKGVLKGGISVSSDLPEEFYGTWSVVSTLVKTNNPELFRMRSADIWTFQRENDVITLSNPVSGATASITINEVHDKTAVFTRESRDNDSIETETPEITVKGNGFSGTDLIIIKYFRKGKRIKTDIVKYKVRGYKISDPTLKDIFAK